MSFTDLDAERRSVGMSVTGFCERFGIPTSTWYRWRRSGSAARRPWPRPVGDAVETAVKDKATQFDAWGHRKLAELLRIEDGLSVSDSTVYRVLDRLGLCLPANYTGESVSSLGFARRRRVLVSSARCGQRRRCRRSEPPRVS